MGMDICARRIVAVSQPRLYIFHRYSIFQQQRCARMTKLAEAENDIWYDIVRGYGLHRSLFRRKRYFHGTKRQKTSTRRNG